MLEEKIKSLEEVKKSGEQHQRKLQEVHQQMDSLKVNPLVVSLVCCIGLQKWTCESDVAYEIVLWCYFDLCEHVSMISCINTCFSFSLRSGAWNLRLSWTRQPRVGWSRKSLLLNKKLPSSRKNFSNLNWYDTFETVYWWYLSHVGGSKRDSV